MEPEIPPMEIILGTDHLITLVESLLEPEERLGRVAITIEDWATPEQLRELGVPGLYGLYTGVAQNREHADFAPPARITIFRGPLARDFRTPEALREKVIDTVQHEIAHHFGISDERLHELALERRAGG